MEVICIETEAFYALIAQVVKRVKEDLKHHEKWISDKEAMHLLNIKSKSTLQSFRDSGQIRFSQPARKVILYDKDSIYAFLEKHVREPFAWKILKVFKLYSSFTRW